MTAPLATNVPTRVELLFRVVPIALYAAAIFYFATSRFSVLPPRGLLSSDKLLHALVFGGFTVLLYRGSYLIWQGLSRLRHCLLAVAVAVFVGVLVECVQFFLSYRSAEFLDIVADSLGSVAFAALSATLRIERRLVWKF